MGVGDQRHAPAALPTGKTRYPFYKRLGKRLRKRKHIGLLAIYGKVNSVKNTSIKYG